LIGDREYISQETCLDILKQGKSKRCKEIVNKLDENDDKTNRINLELKYKLSDNSKLELEKEIRIEELEKDIKMKELELEIEQEKTKQMSIQSKKITKGSGYK
jgi:hypothetical protein